MKPFVAGAALGALIDTFGVGVTAWIALAIAVVVIVVDYQTHEGPRT